MQANIASGVVKELGAGAVKKGIKIKDLQDIMARAPYDLGSFNCTHAAFEVWNYCVGLGEGEVLLLCKGFNHCHSQGAEEDHKLKDLPENRNLISIVWSSSVFKLKSLCPNCPALAFLRPEA